MLEISKSNFTYSLTTQSEIDLKYINKPGVLSAVTHMPLFLVALHVPVHTTGAFAEPLLDIVMIPSLNQKRQPGFTHTT